MKNKTVRPDNRTGGNDLLQGVQLPLAAAITAGGQSRRFGHDKALYEIGGVTLLNRVAASLQTCGPRLLIAPVERYSVSGWQNVPDLRPGEGPLAGLEAALAAVQEHGDGWLAYSAVDLPNLTQEYWAFLACRRSPGVLAVVAHDEGGRPQPLAALYHTAALPEVQALLDAGERRMGRLLGRTPVCHVVWSELGALFAGVFENLNVPPER